MRLYFSLLFVFVLSVQTVVAQRRTELVNGNRAVASEVLVKFRTADATTLTLAAQAADADLSEGVGISQDLRLIRSRTQNVTALLQQFSNRPEVEYVEPNYIISANATPSDTHYSALWGLRNSGQTGGTPGADIEAEAAWDISKGSSAIAVGVLDSGVDYTHSDLIANLWSAPAPYTITVGGRTLSCPAGSRGFHAAAFTCNPLDDNGHGTHVSGTIGAVGNNGKGVTGVNWTTRIIGVKMLDANGSGTLSDAINAIDYLIQVKAAFAKTATPVDVRIISASWGGAGFSQALLDAVNRANAGNILFVAAAGNAGQNTDISPNYPSGFNAPNVISVAATDAADNRASFSNYGATSVDLAAPGVGIVSTMPGGGYASMTGTSMATPHVSGVAALALSYCKVDTPALRDLILKNAEPLPTLAGQMATGGRLNAFRVLRGCAGSTFSLSTNPATRSAARGSTASFVATITPQSGFTGPVNLAVTGLPAGVTATFTANPVSVNSATAQNSTLNLAVGATAALGTYNLTITAVGGGVTQTKTIGLTITAAPGFTLAATPSSRSVTVGQATTFSFTITPENGFTGSVSLSLSGAPTGVTSTFSANPVAVPSAVTSTLNVQTAASTVPGAYNLTVTAVGGGVTRQTTVSLSIAAANGTTGTASFIKIDKTTAGSWKGTYGADGFHILNHAISYPSYVTVTPSANSSFTWASSTTDVRGLQKSALNATDRIASCWYSGVAFTMDFAFNDQNAHQVAFYVLDWDPQNRQQRIDILDSNNNLLDSRVVTSFAGGQYYVWNLSGRVRVRVVRMNGSNAVVSGIFFK